MKDKFRQLLDKVIAAEQSSVLEEFNAAEHLQAAASAQAKQNWLNTKAQYGLGNPPVVSDAEALEQGAATQEQQGHFSQGLAQWKAAKASWASVPGAASEQMAR